MLININNINSSNTSISFSWIIRIVYSYIDWLPLYKKF